MVRHLDKQRFSMLIELAIIGAFAVAALLFEEISVWLAAHNDWDIDEIFFVTIVLTTGLCVFSVRRWRELSRTVAERDRTLEELHAAKDKAEVANRAKGEFLANMSHEVRTPMNAIIGMTDLVLDTELKDEQRDFLTLVKHSSQSLLQVLNDVLDFSKIEAGRLDLENNPFDVRELVEEIGKTMSVRAQEKGLELACRVAPEIADQLTGDPMRLRQILVNLVGNAIKFTAQGEIVVSVDIADSTENAMELRFSVRDTGVGIPMNKQQVIFEAFRQADGASTRRFGGTGLGLTISARLVALMSGRIWVESTAGSGSTFYFTARFERLVGVTNLHSRQDHVSLQDVAVLVVDDNATNRTILREMLMGWHMEPTCVESGVAAVATLMRAASSAKPFPLVLLDAMMPGMDGFAVAEQLKAEPELAQTTIMMLSSGDSGGDAARCRRLGIANYLRKPVTQAELFEGIVAALAGTSAVSPAPAMKPAEPIAENTRRLNILLAEDNLVNQQLATRIIEKRGHDVTAVNNGREVLEALACERFDLIVMDIQMPEMDGAEATAAIRAKEEGTGEHIPIIAVTAHAMKGDRERCLASGTDDYLSKPIDPKALMAAINRLTPHVDRSTEAAPRDVEPAAAPLSPALPADAAPLGGAAADPQGVIDIGALTARVEQDFDLLEELIGLFLNSSSELSAEIEAAVSAGDSQQVERCAHALKGALMNVGAGQCAETASRIETLGRRGDLEHLDALLAALRAQLAQVCHALTEVSQGIQV